MGRCEIVDVDGEPIRVQVNGTLTDEERAALAEIVRAARRKFEADRE